MVKVMKWTKRSMKKKNLHWRRSALLCAFFPLLAVGLISSVAYVNGANEEREDPVIAEVFIEDLVTQLGDESFEVRVRAMRELWLQGGSALRALGIAVEGGDPEVSSRASELILYITAGVLPDTPEDTKKLVMKFSSSSLINKLTILRKLIELSQWQQVLHLAKSEQDPVARDRMAGLVQEAASKAARESIIAGDYDLTREILDLAGDDEQNMVMRAWFYVCNGQLQSELTRAAAMPGKRGAVWRMSLHRADGNLKAAIKEAEKAGLKKLAAGMRVFTGEAIPLLDEINDGNEFTPILSMGYQLQKARLLGEHKKAAAIADELSRVKSNKTDANRAAVCLAANGFREEAVALLAETDGDMAFKYFDSIESPEKSLAALGLPKNAEAPYTEWVKGITKDAINDRGQRDRLITLASFLNRRGEQEHALSVMRPIMQALEDDGADSWFDMLNNLREYGLGWIAITFADERGDKEGVMDLSVSKILGANDTVKLIWGALKNRHPEDNSEALHELALLAGLIADTGNETDKIHAALVESVLGENPNPELPKDKFIEALYSFTFKRNNALEVSKLVDRVAIGDVNWQRPKVFLDGALHRWEKVEPVYAKLAKDKPADYLNLINWCIALRKLGRNKAAEEAYDRALMISLGDPKILAAIAAKLSGAGYNDEAVGLWEQSAVMAPVGVPDYEKAIGYLAIYGEHLYHSKQWQKAAAIHEVYSGALMRGHSGTGSFLNMEFRVRFYADFCSAMYQLENGERALAIKKLDQARQLIPGDGSLADHFFPVLRTAGLGAVYDEWFEDSYRPLAVVCKLYPGSHNTQNTAAWLASRALRRLDDAHKHAQAALREQPLQGAYLDTMAEVWFARGERIKAIEWSEKAIKASVGNAQGAPRGEGQELVNFSLLHRQLSRFKKAPLSK